MIIVYVVVWDFELTHQSCWQWPRRSSTAKNMAGYVAYVEMILDNEKTWVLLFWLSTKTRGHDTNTYSEVSIWVLKDIALHWTRTFNVVALVKFVAVVLEKYFQDKIWQHATHRVADRRLSYDSPLMILPEAQQLVIHIGNERYRVSSCTKKRKLI